MKGLSPVDEGTWWEVARRCDYATFFHTPLWSRLGEGGSLGIRDVSFAVRLDSGTRVVFPLFERRRSRVRPAGEVQSTFAGCYGGPIADGPLAPEEWRSLYETAAAGRGHAALNGNPLVQRGLALPGFATTEDTTQALRLDAPFDEIFSRFSKGHRSSTNRGRREGVTTRRATSIEDYQRYFTIYQSALRRWGPSATSRYSWPLFEAGCRLATGYPENLILWVAEVDGRMVAGAWVFYWNHHAVHWHGAADDMGRQLSATNVVLADAIADAQRRGLDWFDFNPSGGHRSVADFKRRFGTRRLPFVRYRRRNGPVRRFGQALVRILDGLR